MQNLSLWSAPAYQCVSSSVNSTGNFEGALPGRRIEEINEAARFFANPSPISPPRRRDNGRRHRQNTSLRVVPRVENRFRAERHGGGEGASLLAVSGSDSASWVCGEPLIMYTIRREGSGCRMTSQPEREQPLCIYSIRTSLSLFLGAPLHRTSMFLSRTSLLRFAVWFAAE